MCVMSSKKMAIAMFGQKRLSREGGIEIVVKELCTRMAKNGYTVTCYNRSGHHVSGAEYDKKTEYEGINQKCVPTIEKKGLAAVSSSFFAALYSAFGKYNVVHIHAEGPAFFSWLPKLLGKRVAIYTDLMRVALLEHYGGTWMDATILLTDEIPQEILNSDFFVFHNSLGEIDNPVLYPVWFIHAKQHNRTICEIRNVLFAYWKRNNHVPEYLFSNIVITQIMRLSPEVERKMPYLNSDYSEYLVRVLGDKFTEEKFNWIKRLTGIHKLTSLITWFVYAICVGIYSLVFICIFHIIFARDNFRTILIRLRNMKGK